MKKKNIVWLASYPKSGNTWFRSFLSVVTDQKELDINNLDTSYLFSNKEQTETVLDVNCDYLSHEECINFRKIALSHLSNTSMGNIYVKTHDCFSFLGTTPHHPEESTFCAIYFVRNPLDVTLSYANHTGLPVEEVIERFIVQDGAGLYAQKSRGFKRYPSIIGSWNENVEGWLKYPKFPVHFIRYEDLRASPFETFKTASEKLRLNLSDEEIRRGVSETAFDKMQAQEKASGFKEKPNPSSMFFFKGEVGRWKKELSQNQVETIRNHSERMMRHFGYW